MLSLVLQFVLLVLIGSFSNADAISSNFLFGPHFMLILLPVLCLAYLCASVNWMRYVAAILAVVCLVNGLMMDPPYVQRPRALHDARRPLMDAWLEAATRADRQGDDTVILYSPYTPWPHPEEWMGEVLGSTLVRHNITGRELRVIVKEQK